MNNNLTQWKKRVIIFQFIYSFILSSNFDKEKFLNEIKKNNYQTDEYIFKTLINFYNNFFKYSNLIKENLSNNWTFERVSNIDKAIIYTSMSEFNTFKIDKKILIDQALITAKKYSENNSYKFINFILDKVL